jgi:hypothetical protein
VGRGLNLSIVRVTRPLRVRVPLFGLDLCSGLAQPRDWRSRGRFKWFTRARVYVLAALCRSCPGCSRELLTLHHLSTGRRFKCVRFMSVMSIR